MKKLLVAILLLGCLQVSAQPFTPEEALLKFSKYPQERLFVQFDKADYLAGETMHLKAYIFSKFALSRISTNLYFEYLDKNKKVIYKNSVPIYVGIADASFSIPKTLAEGVYYFRAYTSWMLNFDEKFQFIKPINIYNPSSATKLIGQPADWSASITPEGGTLIDNLSTKCAVRLFSAGKLPQHPAGYLFENTDPSKKIADIRFFNEEIGSVVFVPVYGKNYSIRITDDKQTAKVVALPVILQQGVALSVNPSADINYSITSKGLSDPLKGYKIIAENNGELIYSAVIKNSTEAVNSSIKPDTLTKGVVHITLFDAAGNAVAERLCFYPPKVTFTIPPVMFTQKSSSQKGLNVWSIATDTLNNYTYTVIISDGNIDPDDNSQNFLTTYWLGEALSRPALLNGYFNTQNTDAANALDHLLMSENWGKTGWSKFLAMPVPILKYFPDNYLTYQGLALSNKKILPNSKMGIVIQVSDSAKEFLSVTTDNLGKFTLKNIEFRDTAKAFYRINNLENTSSNIEIEFTKMDDSKPFAGPLPQSMYTTTNRKAGDSIPQRIKEYMTALTNSENDDERYKKLEGVVIQAKARDLTRELNKTLSSPIFSEPGEIIFDFVNKFGDETGSGLVDFLYGRVPGLTLEDGIPKMRGLTLGVYINEFAADYDQLSTYPLTDIALVKVLRNANALGAAGPVLVVYTKTGSIYKNEAVSTIKNVKITGYPKVEKFKMVDYGDEKSNTAKNDTRNLLYWNTTWIPNENKQQVRFYNNDISNKFRLMIIGFSKDGIPVYLDKILPE